MNQRHILGAISLVSCSACYYKTQRTGQVQAESLYSVPYFKAGATLNPKYEKRFKDGEDSYMISKDCKTIMVADGVGGWGEMDVDSGLFSRFLTAQVKKLLEHHETRTNPQAREALWKE